MHLRHKWEVVSARQRSQPVATELTKVTGEFVQGIVQPKTDILYRCSCGEVKSVDIHGYWELWELRGETRPSKVQP